MVKGFIHARRDFCMLAVKSILECFCGYQSYRALYSQPLQMESYTSPGGLSCTDLQSKQRRGHTEKEKHTKHTDLFIDTLPKPPVLRLLLGPINKRELVLL